MDFVKTAGQKLVYAECVCVLWCSQPKYVTFFLNMRLFCLYLLSFLCSQFVFAQQPNIIPAPAEYTASTGYFAWTAAKPPAVFAQQPEAMAAANWLQTAKPGGVSLNKAGKAGNNTVQLSLLTKADDRLGKEGYRLVVNPSNVQISANTGVGLFYGVQSLVQMIDQGRIAAGTIVDYPRFGWRGLMLDVSRNFFPKEDVKKYIDQMARYKLNVFHWHLTDDNGWRIEIKSLPKLTTVGACRVPRGGNWGKRDAPKRDEPATDCGFYTQDDIREIVQYAAERHITIVPEIDVPGHSMAAIAAYPELACTRDPKALVNPGTSFADWFDDGSFKMNIDNTLNPASEATYTFLDKVFTEIAQLFPNPYIHIGGDECYMGYWESNHACRDLMEKEGMKDVHELHSYFNARLEKILNAKGKKLLGWDEILEGKLAKTATVMSWRGTKGGIQAAKDGHQVVMSPTTFCYLDYMQGDHSLEPTVYAWLPLRKVYSFEPVPEGVDAKYILGGQGNVWTENIPNLRTAQYMTYPRGLAIAEVFWTPAARKNWPDFSRRVENEHKYLDAAQIRYSKAMYDAIVWPALKDDKLKVELLTEANDIDIYYTIDGTMPDNFSKKYTAPIEIPNGLVTLRVITYRGKTQIGRTITLTREQLLAREKKMRNQERTF